MATGSVKTERNDDNTEALLKCSICLETFKEPRYLPCLHTFCKLCIQTYISTVQQKNSDLNCPVCRNPVEPITESETNNSEALADSLPVNDFIASLVGTKSIQNEDKLCNSCQFRQLETKAVFWCPLCEETFCKPCSNYHNTSKLTAKHKQVSILELRKGQINMPGTEVIYCEIHPERVVEVFCVDHSKPCCTLCATLSHRKCDHVVSISEAANGIKQNKETTETLARISEQEHLLGEIIQNREENETNIETEASGISTAITKWRSEINKHLDRIENVLRGDLEATKKQTLIKVSDELNDFTSLQSAASNWKSLLTCAMKHGSDQQCLIALNKIKLQLNKQETEVQDKLNKVRVVSLRFKQSEALTEFEKTIISFGNIGTKTTKISIKEGKVSTVQTDFRGGKIKIIRSIDLASKGHSAGIFVADYIVFAVFNTSTISKYAIDGNLISQLKIASTPYDVAISEGTKLAVTSKNKIIVIESNDMTLIRTIEVPAEVNVYGISTFDDNYFILGSGCGTKLTWVNQMTGIMTKSIRTSGSSCFVSTSKNNDYVHGDEKNSVSYVVNDTKKFTYTSQQLCAPRGIGIDDESNFYIAGYDSRNIHQITDSGELIRVIPAYDVGVTNPWVVRFKTGTNKFLVTCLISGKATICEIV